MFCKFANLSDCLSICLLFRPVNLSGCLFRWQYVCRPLYTVHCVRLLGKSLSVCQSIYLLVPVIFLSFSVYYCLQYMYIQYICPFVCLLTIGEEVSQHIANTVWGFFPRLQKIWSNNLDQRSVLVRSMYMSTFSRKNIFQSPIAIQKSNRANSQAKRINGKKILNSKVVRL